MKRALGLLFSVGLLVAGCGSHIEYRPGTTFARAQSDDAQCKARAAQQYPSVIIIEREWVCERDSRICDTAGNCETVRGDCYLETYHHDINAARRSSAARACMSARGYTGVTLPNCPATVQQSVTPQITTVMPDHLTERACVIKRATGLQIVNRP